MPAKRLLPSDSTLKKWVEEGLSHQDIVDRVLERENVVVSKSGVAAALSRAGLTNRIRYDTHVPWTPIRPDHARAYPLTMLRYLARRDAGEQLLPQTEERLNSWLERLREEDAVVDYDYNSAQGFIYRRRKKGDHRDPPIRPPKKT
jgi:hypothetical protein